MSEGKAAMISFSALCLTQPCLSAFTTTPNNWREGLIKQIPTLGTPFRRKEIIIKKEWKETERGAKTPQHTRGTRKSSSGRTEDQSSLVNSIHLSLIMKNTVLTVVRTLNPSSLAHSLQIHCTGLTGLKSHASWAWAEKCDPTISYPIQNLIEFFFNFGFLYILNNYKYINLM